MDTLTHALVGAAISDGWFRKRLGPTATPFALAAAALPDIDIIVYLVAPETAWAHHRGYTHSLFPMLLAAPLLGYAGYRFGRRRGDWIWWSLLALLCLFSHTALDLATSWGTMPLLPFSNARISWDVAPIVDLFVLSLTAASFVANRLLRWERVDTFVNPLAYPIVHRHPRRQAVADKLAMLATVLAVAYLLLGWQQNRQTVRIAERELAAAGIRAVEVRALPLLLTYVSWGIAARDADGVVYNAVYSSYAPRPMQFAAYPGADDAGVRAVLRTPEGALFSWYAQGMFVAETRDEGAREVVVLQDRRFFGLARSHLARFLMRFTFDPSGAVEPATGGRIGVERMDMGEELRRLWNLTLHGQAVLDE